mmetsp:Transcript_101563/g.296052  ORF Transcript_101563/g.296052 Transcript_101563/m.296052 type:complete len:344 (-) Transcript_101563:16-1047(-)
MQLPGQGPDDPSAGLEAGPSPLALSGGFSLSAGPERLYGALLDQQLATQAAAARDLKHRRRLNCVSVLLAFILPWGLFLTSFSLATFSIHYTEPMATVLCVLVIFVLSLNLLVTNVRDKSKTPESRFFPTYIGAACTVAVGLGWIIGDVTFWSFMHPSYEAERLAKYYNVDPSSLISRSGEVVATRGRRYQDAGQIYFSYQAIVDVNRSASFKMGDLYCVAPIVNPTCSGSCGHDFWAVGKNCCSERGSEFWCDGFNNPRAKSGIRMLTTSTRPYYRLAVLQAEGMHGLSSTHPLFFRWVEDPVAQIAQWKRAGVRRFLVVMYGSFFVSLACLAVVLKSTRRF